MAVILPQASALLVVLVDVLVITHELFLSMEKPELSSALGKPHELGKHLG